MTTPPLYQLFAAQVSADPQALAVDGPTGSYTYRQLDAWAGALADQLRQHGAGPRSLVGLCLDRSAAQVAAVLAVLRLGGVCVPLDPQHPTPRLATVLSNLDCSLLLTEPDQRERFGPPLRPLALAPQPPTGLADPAPPGSIEPDDLAYAFHTSGSTGVPKAVGISHRNLLNLVAATEFLQLGPGSRVGQCVSPIFDLTNLETWCALPRGATLVIAPRRHTADIDGLLDFIGQQRIDTLVLATGVFRLAAARGAHRLAGVRQLVVGGEAADLASFTAVQRESRPQRLINVYGPAEATSFVTSFTLPADWSERPIPIGRPIGGVDVLVLDDELQPVPVGVVGEIFLGGKSVGRGYLGQPARTAERFVPDPAPPSDQPGRRLYRTGDLGHQEPTGEIVYRGRRDGQVKLRGNRVELAEIEAALAAESSVAAAAAAIWEPTPGDQRLVACVIAEEQLDLPKLRETLRARVPEFMVPALLVQTDALPLTGNGKVDRPAVTSLVLAAEPAATAAVPASTPAEPASTATASATAEPADEADELLGHIAAAWAETLRRQVDQDANFFDSGGHSLLLLELHARIEQRLGRSVSLIDLVEFPTIAGLAAHLRSQPGGPA